MVALWGVPAVAMILAGALARLVSEKFAGVETPVTEAVTLYGPPTVPLAVKIAAVATPCALVTAVLTPPANVPLAPLVGAVKVTVTPFTGLLDASLTVACSCVANAVLMVALWGVPAVALILAGALAKLVNANFFFLIIRGPPRSTFFPYPTLFRSVKIAAVATPCALVTAVLTPPANVPLAPLVGAVKVTVTPLTGLLKESFTVACSCVANAVLTVALCRGPAVALMFDGLPSAPNAALNAANPAPQLSAAARDAPAEASPAVVCI